MYEELIQRLEHAAGGPEGIKMAHDAAAAISALQAENAAKDRENERLKVELRYKQDECESHYGDYCEAKAELARVEAERDAANGYLEKIDGMFGAAYPNEILAVLDKWRDAQEEV